MVRLAVKIYPRRFFRPTAIASPIGREHHVNDDASHRDVEPDRERESGQAAMSGETAGKRQEERDQNHRQSQHGEANVRDEQRKIDHPTETLALKMHVTM